MAGRSIRTAKNSASKPAETSFEAMPALSATATERIREFLRREILSARLLPGARLKITEVAARYGISPIPVREAMRLLAGEGLVDIAPHRGAIVRSVDADYIANMYDIRAALEAMLVERAAEHVTDADLETIAAASAVYHAACRAGQPRAVLDANVAFHSRINAAARNVEAEKVLDRGWELIRAMRLGLGFSRARLAENMRQHGEIVAALGRRDGPRAAKAMKLHCISGRDDLLRVYGAAARAASRKPAEASAPTKRAKALIQA